MKKLLTVLVCAPSEEILPPCDEVEVLYTDEERTQGEIIENGLKQIKSKYTVLAETVKFSGLQPYLDVLNNSVADIVTFDGGVAIKSALFRNATKKNCDRFSAQFFALLNAKTVEKSDLKPFGQAYAPTAYSEADEERLITVLDEFKKCKARLTKEVFTYVSDLLCKKLIDFYTAALIAVHKGEITAETLKNFDLKLKQNIVLYIAMQKRFTSANLQKLREKNFKINFFTYKKLKKSLNKK